MENMNEIEGGDVIDLGLGSVLFDVNKQTYYTPNTDSTSDVKTLEEESFIDDLNDTERAASGEQMSIDDLSGENEEAKTNEN
jgi:hypothetical protein